MRATHAALHFHQIYKSQAAPQADIMLLPLGTGGFCARVPDPVYLRLEDPDL
jgi:hypothetical protein